MNKEIEEFNDRWKQSGGKEMASFQSFAWELVQLLGLKSIKVTDAEGQ